MLLSSHATECMLKAIFLNAGGQANSIKAREVRHSLVKLWIIACAKESRLLPKGAPMWAAKLNDYHEPPYVGRYISGITSYMLPDSKQVLAGVEDLFSKSKVCLGIP